MSALNVSNRRVNGMNTANLPVGYRCPRCDERVVVFTLDDPSLLPDTIASKCRCGYSCIVPIEEIGGLEVWMAPEYFCC